VSAPGIFGHRNLFWRVISSWMVPVMMTAAYLFMMFTTRRADDEPQTWVARGWMAIGLLLVYVVWGMFRFLTTNAALARAVAVGDSDRLLEIVDAKLGRKERPSPLWIYRAIGLELRGDHAEALAALDRVRSLNPRQRALAANVRVAALVEQGKVSEAREVFDRDLAALRDPAATLSEARILWAEHDPKARDRFAKIVDDIRAGAAQRADAHRYLSKIAEADGDAATAAKHSTAAMRLRTFR
jgi:hypothetical protein